MHEDGCLTKGCGCYNIRQGLPFDRKVPRFMNSLRTPEYLLCTVKLSWALPSRSLHVEVTLCPAHQPEIERTGLVDAQALCARCKQWELLVR